MAVIKIIMLIGINNVEIGNMNMVINNRIGNLAIEKIVGILQQQQNKRKWKDIKGI